MPNLAVVDMEGKNVGTIELAESVFGIEPNAAVMHQMVVNYLAAQRQGTQSALTRSEVSGGGKKPWRQKGTGRARQGSTRAPQWTGGGVVFAPVPRDYSFKINKKEKRAALKSALTSRVEAQKFVVLDELKLELPENTEYTIDCKDDGIYVNMTSQELGFLIGYRGETLYAMQNIISSIASIIA